MDKVKTLADWSKAVIARDGVCVSCGTARALVAHHKKPKATHPELKLAIDNGIALCANCHVEHHKMMPVSTSPRVKTKLAILKAENTALKEELSKQRSLPRYLTDLHQEIINLKAQITEYEIAYDALLKKRKNRTPAELGR